MKMPGFVEERTVQGHTHVSSSQARGCMRSRPWGAVCQASVKPTAVYVTATSASKTRPRPWRALASPIPSESVARPQCRG